MNDVADVAPGLLEALQVAFVEYANDDPKLKTLLEKIEGGEATYDDVMAYASEVGLCLEQAFTATINDDVLPDSKMYYNIAQRLIEPMLSQNHELVSEQCVILQNNLNRKAGLGLKAVAPTYNSEKVNGIISYISNAEKYSQREKSFLDSLSTYTRSVVDDSVKSNAEFHYQSGLSPKIVRRTDGSCCEWCSKIAGVYEYAKVRNAHNDVFRRHANCQCTVEYDPGNGSKRVQDVWSKKWSSEKDPDKIEERKLGKKKQSIIQDIVDHPAKFALFTPAELKKSLEDEGFEVKPLGKGSLKGISFEDGGGYRINFGGDGLLQYHPKEKIHHGGAYYKIAAGKGGIHRYELDGTEQED